MTTLTLERANQIIDRISEIAENGEYLKPVSLSRVGATSVYETISALYLVTAETFKTASLNNNPRNQDVLKQFIQAAGGTGMWIVTRFHQDGQREPAAGVDGSVRDAETINSFVEFLHSLNPAASDYWSRVYSRIGIPLPEALSVGPASNKSWWQRIFG